MVKKGQALISIILLTMCMSACAKNVASRTEDNSAPVSETESSSEEVTFFVHPGIREQEEPEDKYGRDWQHGSCKDIRDKTIIVSIFLSDRNYSWDSEKDSDQMDRELENLSTASEWIKNRLLEYEIETDYIYDWKENPELRLDFESDEDIAGTEDERIIWDIIDNNIDSGRLLEQFKAENILYMIVENVPKNWNSSSFTWIYEEDKYPYEFTVIYPYNKGARVGAASYAHEILHAFGAHDLYLADENETYVVSEAYLNHLKETGSRDIMYTVYDMAGHHNGLTIDQELTALDAYYIGVGEKPEEVEEFGLDKSEYQGD